MVGVTLLYRGLGQKYSFGAPPNVTAEHRTVVRDHEMEEGHKIDVRGCALCIRMFTVSVGRIFHAYNVTLLHSEILCCHFL